MGIISFYWNRHARPINPGDIAYGADMAVDLSGKARSEIRRQARILPNNAHWISGPLPRHKETAAVYADMKNQQLGQIQKIARTDIRIESRFSEQSFGTWAGKLRKELFNDAAFQEYRANPAKIRPPQGESLEDLATRVKWGIEDIIGHARKSADHIYHDENYIIHASAGSIRAAISDATKMPVEDTLHLAVDPLSMTLLTYDTEKWARGKHPWTLEYLNRTP